MNTNLKTVLSLIFLLNTTLLHGQDNDKLKKYKNDPEFGPGSIIDNSGNKMNGLIKDVSEFRRYNEVVFITIEGNREKYTPSEIKAYGDQSGRYLSDGENFLKVIKHGKSISLFKLVILRTSGSGMNTGSVPITLNYFKKTNEESFKSIPQGLSFTSFSKDIGAYFSDCESLSQKIETKEFKKDDLEEIVDFYNNNCGN